MKIQLAIIVPALEFGLLMAPVSLCPAQNPFTALEDAAKEKAAEAALTKVLNDNLPLKLDAKDVYPTVTTLPGGPFSPKPLQLTADQLDQPLAPGDYTINTLDFCSEYSVHQPGAGVAYVLGPYEGKAAGAIGALIWRGTEQYGIAPQSLQAVSWAIQSGLTYNQMPKSYQAIVDQVIPDLKNQITGDFVANLESTYNDLAKTAKLPPLDTMLAKLGAPGRLALDAERQRQILTSQNTSDELKQQTLFQGQESGVYTPVKAETGPWTERIKGQVYMKLLIAGGNMASNNVMQIRVMPPPATTAQDRTRGPHLVRTAYGEPQLEEVIALAPTLYNILEGLLGYSQGQGAQALGQVAVVQKSAPAQPPPPVVAGTVKDIDGSAYVQRAGTDTWTKLNPGDPFYINDVLESGGSRSDIDIVMADGTKWTIGPDSEWTVQNYQYNKPSLSDDVAGYGALGGVYMYLHQSLSTPSPPAVISTVVGNLGIRGTEFVLKVDPTAKTMEIDLIQGSVAITPAGSTTAGPAINAPMQIEVTPQGTKTLRLTQDQYNAIKAQYFPAVPTS
jgi:hypothetical protein